MDFTALHELRATVLGVLNAVGVAAVVSLVIYAWRVHRRLDK